MALPLAMLQTPTLMGNYSQVPHKPFFFFSSKWVASNFCSLYQSVKKSISIRVFCLFGSTVNTYIYIHELLFSVLFFTFVSCSSHWVSWIVVARQPSPPNTEAFSSWSPPSFPTLLSAPSNVSRTVCNPSFGDCCPGCHLHAGNRPAFIFWHQKWNVQHFQ